MANLSRKSERDVLGSWLPRPRATIGRLPWDKNWKGFGKDLEKDLTLDLNTPVHRSAGAADIEDALRASTAAPFPSGPF